MRGGAVARVDGEGSGTAAIPTGVEDADTVWVTREPRAAVVPNEPPVIRVNLG